MALLTKRVAILVDVPKNWDRYDIAIWMECKLNDLRREQQTRYGDDENHIVPDDGDVTVYDSLSDAAEEHDHQEG